MSQKPDQCLGEWIDREALAEAMIPLIGQLYRNNNVVTSIFGRGLINRSVIAILKAHRFARHRLSGEDELSVHDSYTILKTMSDMNLGAASVDLGKMLAKFKEVGAADLATFVRQELGSLANKRGEKREGTDVVLYGFGRIGRLLARILIEKTGGGDGLRLRAIVVRKGAENDLVKRASLLRRDSVHGPFDGTITIDEDEQYDDRQRQPDPGDLRQGSQGSRLHPVRHQERAAGRQHRRLARRRRPRSAPQVPGRCARGADRAGQGCAEEHRARHQPRRDHRRRQDHFRGVLHHQRHRAGAQGGQRPVTASSTATSRPFTRTPTTRT